MHHGGLYIDQVGQKVTCFNANGPLFSRVASMKWLSNCQVSVFLIYECALFSMHCTNLVVLSLSGLPMVKKLEALCNSLHFYFNSFPKRYLEFTKLAEVVETSCQKILDNIKTRWILTLEPMKHLLLEYKILIETMSNNRVGESKVAHNLSFF